MVSQSRVDGHIEHFFIIFFIIVQLRAVPPVGEIPVHDHPQQTDIGVISILLELVHTFDMPGVSKGIHLLFNRVTSLSTVPLTRIPIRVIGEFIAVPRVVYSRAAETALCPPELGI
jgi:hypothetical protein